MQQCSLRSPAGRWVIAATVLASGAAFLAGTAVPVSLPPLQSYFGIGLAGLQWVVNAPVLALSALMLVGGGLGDQLGRRRVLLVGTVVCAAAALLSGLAPTVTVLILLQALFGVGAALIVPQSLAIINDCFVDSERGRAIGLWAGIATGFAALGPLAGGWLVDTFSWRWVFFMEVPAFLAAMAIGLAFIPRDIPRPARRLDWPGAALIFGGLFGLAYGLVTGPGGGWTSPGVLAGLVLGTGAIGLFIIIELRLARPLVHLRILRDRLVAGANLATLLLYFGLNGITFFTVLNLEQIQGYTPTEAGLGLLPPILLIGFLSAPAGALADRLGPRPQMVLGPLAVAAGMALLAAGATDGDYLRRFLPGLALVGIGMAAVIPPLTKSALAVDSRYSGSASGINNGISRVAGMLAVAVLGAVVLAIFSSQLVEAVRQTSLTGAEQQMIIEQSDRLGGIVIPDTFGPAAAAEARDAVRSSFVHGFRWAMGICAGLAFAASVAAALTIRPPRRPGEKTG